MKPVIRSLIAFLLAALVPAACIIAWEIVGTFEVPGAANDPYAWLRIRNFGILAILISATHVLVLGMPSFFLLLRFKVVTWWSSSVTGFILGCLPIGVLSWPLHFNSGSSASHGDGTKMVVTLVNGVPTFAGWLEWLSTVGFVGALGFIGGLTFWLVWRGSMRPNNSLKRTGLRPAA